MGKEPQMNTDEPFAPVILSEAKNLSGRSRVNSAKNLVRSLKGRLGG
jgi:hypothetical protein